MDDGGIPTNVRRAMNRYSPSKKVNYGFGVALLILVVIGVMSYMSATKYIQLSSWVHRTTEVINAIEFIHSQVQDRVASERGYVISGDPAYLTPFEAAESKINEGVRRLTNLVSDNQGQMERVARLSLLIDEFLANSREIMRLKAMHNDAEARRKSNNYFVERPKESVRKLLEEMNHIEDSLLETRLKNAREGAKSALVVTVSGSIIAFLFLLFAAGIVYFDIEERKRYTQALIEAREEALQASKSKSQFLANMSHEIRTPMNAIIGMADVLSETELDPDQTKYVKVFKRAGNNLLNLINDILDFSKIEAGKLDLDNVPFNVKEVVDNCIELMSFRASQKGIELTSEIDLDIPLHLMGDPNRLRQILTNLIGNAIKFTENGKVLLKVRTAAEEQGRDLILFSVMDTGRGIARDKQSQIFEKFNQLDPSIGRQYGGTGLGLSISKELVNLMGGSIWVESSENIGSTFFFTFPVREQIKTSEVFDSDVIPIDRRLLNILLVDDSEDNRLLVETYLKKTSYRIVSAENGREAFEKFKEEDFDVVLMDMHMPVMDGYTATREIKKWQTSEGKEHVPIVALTAFALKEERQNSLDAGCVAHITKPVKKETLLRIIYEVTRNAQKRETSSERQSESKHTATSEPQIFASLDSELASLVPRYIQNRRRDHSRLNEAMHAGDFETIRTIGHNVKGTAKSYGFASLGELAARLEGSASTRDSQGLSEQIREFENLLNLIEQTGLPKKKQI